MVDIQRGDLDGDGKITEADSQILINHIIRPENEKEYFDYYVADAFLEEEDNTLSLFDVIAIENQEGI